MLRRHFGLVGRLVGGNHKFTPVLPVRQLRERNLRAGGVIYCLNLVFTGSAAFLLRSVITISVEMQQRGDPLQNMQNFSVLMTITRGGQLPFSCETVIICDVIRNDLMALERSLRVAPLSGGAIPHEAYQGGQLKTGASDDAAKSTSEHHKAS